MHAREAMGFKHVCMFVCMCIYIHKIHTEMKITSKNCLQVFKNYVEKWAQSCPSAGKTPAKQCPSPPIFCPSALNRLRQTV